MCFIKVKEEEDYTVPSRVVRRREHSPRRSTRISVYDERRVSPPRSETYIVNVPEPVYQAPAPIPEPAHSKAPTAPPASIRGAERETISHHVEVEESSSSSSSEDLRSKSSGHRSKASKAAKSRSGGPASEYDVREREYRRERRYTPERNDDRGGYETYRYVNAPEQTRSRSSNERRRSAGPRASYGDDPRASTTSYRRERERVIVEDEGRRQREYYR